MSFGVRFGALLQFLLTLSFAHAKPNIVFVLADDLGWSDAGFLGAQRHKTPNLDALAQAGMVFDNFHTCPNCAPSRAALLTGRYSPRTGVYTVGDVGRFDSAARSLQPVANKTKLPLELPTMGQAMKERGYTTGLFGKWHLGDDGDYHPRRRGFDEAVITSINRHYGFSTNPDTTHPEGQYLADFLTDRAVDFIRLHKDGPFFLYLPHLAVHRPLQADDEKVREFMEKNRGSTKEEAVYGAMVESLDASVGKIRKTLEELGIGKDTVFVFCSDNGGAGGYRREGLDADEVTDNAPLRSGKGSLYEGGVRVPFVIAWPGKIAAGSRCSVPAIHVDLFPTFCALAGADAREGPDGQSLLPWVLDKPDKPERQPIYQHFPGYLGVEGKPGQWRTTPAGSIQAGNWKLMEFFEDGHLELYELEADPGERNNLAAIEPEKARELHVRLAEWRQRTGAPMPTRREPN